MKIRLAAIIESNANGPGLRRVFFSQGCSHACPDCFNQHTWPFEGGAMIDCDEEIKKVIHEFYLAGVTFSGGDPFQQPQPFAYIAKQLKKNNINIWSYTGYTWEELMELSKNDIYVNELLHNIDRLVDGPFMKELAAENIPWRGSSNQRIIDVPESLRLGTIVLDKEFK